MSYAMLARKSEAAPAAPAKVAAKATSGGLRVGEADDAFEQEADRVANEVMTGARLEWSLSKMNVGPPLQRKCACGGSAGAGGGCEECKKKKDLLQRASLSPRGRGAEGEGEVPPIVHDVLRSPGQPLDLATRAFMEPRFGYDFSQVRVHTDAKAAESARAVNALAYTAGRDVVFETGQYGPGTLKGQRLLAHELTHLLQQSQTEVMEVPQPKLMTSPHNDPAEREADEVASQIPGFPPMLNIRSFRRPSAPLQRQEKPPLASVPQPQVSETKDLSLYPYVDDFTAVYYDVDYRHAGGNLSKWLRIEYSDGITIDIHMDNIVGESMTPEEAQKAKKEGRAGEGGRAFPNHMNPVTTPRLWEAKSSAIEAQNQYFVDIVTVALPAVFFIITMPLAVMGGARPTAVRRGLQRGIGALKPPKVFDQTLKAALKQNTLRHIFGKAEHGLDPLVKQLGSEEKVMTEVVKGLNKIVLPQAGLFEETVLVTGRSVTVRGAVVNGIPRVSTMFIKP